MFNLVNYNVRRRRQRQGMLKSWEYFVDVECLFCELLCSQVMSESTDKNETQKEIKKTLQRWPVANWIWLFSLLYIHGLEFDTTRQVEKSLGWIIVWEQRGGFPIENNTKGCNGCSHGQFLLGTYTVVNYQPLSRPCTCRFPRELHCHPNPLLIAA